MSLDKAIVRESIERLEGVSRTYFELESKGHTRTKILVVEVDFDLDVNSDDYSRGKVDAIESTFSMVLREENSDRISKLRIVSHSHRASDKSADATSGQTSSKKMETRLQPN